MIGNSLISTIHSLSPLDEKVIARRHDYPPLLAGSESLVPGSVIQVVKAPGNLVISAYVTCPDITLTVTPDLKLPGNGRLLHVDLGRGHRRLGGSAFAHGYGQVGLDRKRGCLFGSSYVKCAKTADCPPIDAHCLGT